MNVPGVSPGQMQEIQARFGAHARYSSSRDAATTPDGSVRLEVGSSGGGCMEPTYHDIRAFDASGQSLYEHKNKGGDSYSSPVMCPDGRTGFVVASHATRGGWQYQVKRINVKGGWIKRPHTVATVDYPRSLAVSPDGQMLALAVDKDIKMMRTDIGFFGRVFGGGPTSAATLPESVEGMEYLKDGSILAFPSSYERACYLVKAGTPGATRIPLAALSDTRYHEVAGGRLQFVKKTDLDAFIAQAPWMIDDEAQVKNHVSAPSPRAADTHAVVVGDGSAPQAVWKWEGRRFVHLADLPTSDSVNWNTIPRWSADGNLLFVNHGTDTSLIDMRSGVTGTVPGGLSADRTWARPDGSGAVGFSGGDSGPVVWAWGGAGAPAPLATLSSRAPQDKPSAAFSSDGHFVTWFVPQGAERAAVHIVARDGAYTMIPAADAVDVKRDRLVITLGDEKHEVRVPADLATLEQQAWYQRACDNAILGGKQPPKDDLKIDKTEDHVVIGGVEVPIRREPVAS